MPSVLTGANLANRELIYLGVSGDGDSASIGLGQFAHSIRRGVNMTYIVENNGVYGLTKGQFSATSDPGSKSKRGVVNHDQSIDLVGLALQLGASFVGAQLLRRQGPAGAADQGARCRTRARPSSTCISPCVQFNNHVGSTKSFDYVREHNAAVNRLDFIEPRAEIPSTTRPARWSWSPSTTARCCACSKVAPDYDPTDRISAIGHLQLHQARGEIVTGLLYVDPEAHDLHDHLHTVQKPLNQLTDAELVPGAAALDAMNDSLR